MLLLLLLLSAQRTWRLLPRNTHPCKHAAVKSRALLLMPQLDSCTFVKRQLTSFTCERKAAVSEYRHSVPVIVLPRDLCAPARETFRRVLRR